jgi:hypothetical protein
MAFSPNSWLLLFASLKCNWKSTLQQFVTFDPIHLAVLPLPKRFISGQKKAASPASRERPLALAQTDTNGNFSIELPASKKVLLAVHIQGAVNGEPGDYFWLVPLTAGDANSGNLVLNGDNARARNVGFSTQSQNRVRDRGTPY